MIMRLPLLLILILVGTNAHGQAQQNRRTPQCGPERDESRMVREIFLVLTDDYWTSTRAKAGIVSPVPSAPRGVLNDNDACVHLRKAFEQVVGKDSDELSDKYELSFYYAGDYYAVFARVKRDPASELEVYQRLPMRIFSKEKKPRLLMTVYM